MKKIPLTQGKVALVDDEDYGWLMAMGSWHASIKGSGWVAQKRHKGKIRRMHRIILDAPDHLHVDHINHQTLDNRRCNIRLCTRSQNLQNMRKKSEATSKYKGVDWCETRGRWRAQIKFDGKEIHLGYFANEGVAAKVYNKAAQQHFGEFAFLNDV